jgi:hypothetical protein
MGKSPFSKMNPEEVTWLSQVLLEGKYSLKEIINLFHVRFKRPSIKFGVEDLREFARENLTGWTEHESDGLEDAVEEATADVTEDKDFLTPGENKKIDPVSKHRRILLETWKLYQALVDPQDPSTNETAKGKYLDIIAREIDKIAELESKEKSFLSMMEEVRAAEERETAEQFVDYLTGYCLPKLLNKVGNSDKFKEQSQTLKNHIDLLVQILETPFEGQTAPPSLEEAIREYLKRIYTLPVGDMPSP